MKVLTATLAFLHLVFSIPCDAEVVENIVIDLRSEPLRRAFEIYALTGEEAIGINADVPDYLISLSTVAPVDRSTYYRILKYWAELHGLVLSENTLTVSKNGIPDFTERASEPVHQRLKSTLEAGSDKSDATLDLNNIPLDSVLQIVQQLAGRTIIHGALPLGTYTHHAEEVSATEALIGLDQLLLKNGIILFEAEPQLIIAASIKPLEPEINRATGRVVIPASRRAIVLPE